MSLGRERDESEWISGFNCIRPLIQSNPSPLQGNVVRTLLNVSKAMKIVFSNPENFKDDIFKLLCSTI